jgi:hypothetical protein
LRLINGDANEVVLAYENITDTRFITLPDASGNLVISSTTGITGADAVTNIVSLTQAEYNAIGSPSATTLFLITDP